MNDNEISREIAKAFEGMESALRQHQITTKIELREDGKYIVETNTPTTLPGEYCEAAETLQKLPSIIHELLLRALDVIALKNMQESDPPDPGDYVLATKYTDGDPWDGWVIGYYDKKLRDRHLIIDENGAQFRHNGFRRVAKIDQARGSFMITNMEFISNSGKSLWWWAQCDIKEVSGWLTPIKKSLAALKAMGGKP